MLVTTPVVQIAYHVNDIERAATRMYQQFGTGPFCISRNIELACCQHRGVDADFLHSSAYGQWGHVMLELVQQESEGPSVFRDMFVAGEEGLHHTAMFVDSMDAAIEYHAGLGIPLAARATTRAGAVEFAFLDATKTMGHMLEIYVGDEKLRGFYAIVKAAADNWDGTDLLRD